MISHNPKIRAALWSLLAATFLCALKLFTGSITGSLAVLSSGIDSLLDIAMSAINFIAIRRAEKPPDKEHPFGHGKFETVATFLQSLFISGSGFWILFESYRRLQGETRIMGLGGGMAVLIFGALVSLAVSRMLNRVARETDSAALRADAVHFSMDVYTNGALFAGLLAIWLFDAVWLDPILSILVAIYILIEASRLLRHVMRDFLDVELPEPVRKKIINLIDSFDGGFIDFHTLRTRRAGSQKIMDFHLVVCRKITLEEAHKIADSLKNRIEESIQGADVTIHLEPCKEHPCRATKACPAIPTKDDSNGGKCPRKRHQA